MKNQRLSVKINPLAGERLQPLGHLSVPAFLRIFSDLASPIRTGLCSHMRNLARTFAGEWGKSGGVAFYTRSFPLKSPLVDISQERRV